METANLLDNEDYYLTLFNENTCKFLLVFVEFFKNIQFLFCKTL